MNQAVQVLPHQEITRYDDEIDLFELVSSIWQKKNIIASITFVATMLAALVAFKLPTTWESSTKIYKAESSDLTDLNIVWSLLNNDETANPVTPGITYSHFYRALSSPKVQWKAFSSSGLEAKALEDVITSKQEQAVNAAWIRFTDLLVIERSDEDKKHVNPVAFTKISFQSDDQKFSAQLINDYLLPEAYTYARELLLSNLESDRSRKLVRVDRQIAEIETQFIESNQTREIAIKDALAVAKAGNIEQSDNLNLSRTLGDKSFMLGTRILNEQLNIQQKEINRYQFFSRNDKYLEDKRPYLPAVASILIGDRQRISGLDLSNLQWNSVSQDLPALVPAAPIKPKKSLIVALGLILGLMVGVFTALIKTAVEKRRVSLTAL